MRRARRILVLLAVTAALLTACTSVRHGQAPGGSRTPSVPGSSQPPTPPSTQPAPPPAALVAPLAAGERWIDLPMPGGSYRPQAPPGATDDYRCILLDPRLTRAAYLSGAVLEPGNPKIVHHAILYRIPPDQVAAAEAKDAGDPRLGWSCFGDVGVRSQTDPSALGFLDSAPWVAAWATRGGEQRFAAGTGQLLAAGSRIVLQMHYNLLAGKGTDDTRVRLRIAPKSAHLTGLQTMLLPAPVELPCASGQSGPLCDRTAALINLQQRFGQQAGATVAGLQLLCGGSLTNPRAGATQSCTRPVQQRMRIRAVAGHMHLLGRSIRIDLLRAGGGSRRLLDVKVWDFDNQSAHVLPHAVAVRPGDRLRVTCTHDAALRDQIPELRTLPERYVMWGEGTADEMCLGIVSYTS